MNLPDSFDVHITRTNDAWRATTNFKGSIVVAEDTSIVELWRTFLFQLIRHMLDYNDKLNAYEWRQWHEIDVNYEEVGTDDR